jgi:hypothetical protein
LRRPSEIHLDVAAAGVVSFMIWVFYVRESVKSQPFESWILRATSCPPSPPATYQPRPFVRTLSYGLVFEWDG